MFGKKQTVDPVPVYTVHTIPRKYQIIGSVAVKWGGFKELEISRFSKN
jgi:hypothetical protein